MTFSLSPSSQTVAAGSPATTAITWAGGATSGFSFDDAGGGAFSPLNIPVGSTGVTFDYTNAAAGIYTVTVTGQTGPFFLQTQSVTITVVGGTTTITFDEGPPGSDAFIKTLWVARFEEASPGADGIGDRPPDLATFGEDAPGEDAFFKAKWTAIFAEAFPPGSDTFVKPPFIQFNEYLPPGGDGFGSNSTLCAVRLRSQYCPDCEGGFKTPYTVHLLSEGNVNAFDAADFITIVGPTTTGHSFTIPNEGAVNVESLIETALSWWRPTTGFADFSTFRSTGFIGDILPDDLIAQLQYVLQLVQIEAKITRTGHRHTARGRVQFDSAGNRFFNVTSETVTAKTDEQLIEWSSHVGDPVQILSDEGAPGWFDDSECFEVNPFYDDANGYAGLGKFFTYDKLGPGNYSLFYDEWETVTFEWTLGQYLYAIYHYVCCDQGCPDPGPPITIPSGTCLDVNLGSSFIDCDDLPGSATITGPVPEIAAGCTLVSFLGCIAHVCTPCLTREQIKLKNYMGPYTVIIPTDHGCTEGGGCLCEVLVGQFYISASQICDEKPPAGYAAIEADGPRQWFHVGLGGTVATYDTNYSALFAGNNDKIDSWRRFRADPRYGTLAMLAKSKDKFQVWLSTDGGQTSNKEIEVTATSALLERDSERNWILFYTADDHNFVQVRISEDGGETFGDPQDVPLDGKPLQARLLDSCEDSRAGGRIGMVVSIGKDPNTLGTTAIMVSDDGGLTFRKVI